MFVMSELGCVHGLREEVERRRQEAERAEAERRASDEVRVAAAEEARSRPSSPDLV